MNVRGKTLAQRIRLEINELEEIGAVIDRHWQRAMSTTEDQDAFLNSVALNLY